MIKHSIKLLFLLIAVLTISSYAQHRKVSNNGLDIYYRIFGEGKPLLIIGGGPGDVSDRYLSLCKLISDNYCCILADQRGTGLSIPPVFDSTTISVSLTLDDFELIRENLGYEKWNVLGFSYGGYLASIYANNFPSSVNSLVLLGSSGLNTDTFTYFRDNIISRMSPEDIERMNYWSDSTRLANDPEHAITERIRSMMPGYFYDRKKSYLVSQIIKPGDFNFEMGRLIWNDIIKHNLDLVELGANYSGRVLILHGRQDPLGTSIAEIISRYYINSKLVYIEKCGHYSWIEQPEFVKSQINQFLK